MLHMIINQQKKIFVNVVLALINLASIVQYSINYKLLSAIMLSSRKGSGSILLVQCSEI